MSRPITKAQLDALENVVDRVFANIGIDVEFTRHFLDRVNDERNRKQITIRELGELFAKEYKRWGREIAKMPVDTQAVMKDLSSELNIPFVLNPDGKEKDLVAKTVMRKKNFRTPNKELPVESVNETDSHFEFQGRSRGTSTWKSDDGRTVQLSTWTDYKKTGRNSRLRDPSGTKWKLQIREGGQEVFYKVVGKAEDMESRTRKQRAVNAALKFLEKEYGIDAYEQLWIEGGLPKPDSWGEVKETHGAKRGTQVKGRDATPSKRKPTKGVETPHPMRGKLVGEESDYKAIGSKSFEFELTLALSAIDDNDATKSRYQLFAAADQAIANDWSLTDLKDKYEKMMLKLGRKSSRIWSLLESAYHELMRSDPDEIYGYTENADFEMIKPVRNEETVNEVSGGKVVATVNGYPIHDFGSEYPWTNKRFSIRDPRLDVWQSSAPTLDLAAKKANELSPARSPAPTMSQDQIDHENWRDEQRAKIATGEIRRAVMSRRGLGESDDESFVKQFVKEKRREGWSVYASRINHGVQGAHRLEFERRW
jgi:hypothetical protein